MTGYFEFGTIRSSYYGVWLSGEGVYAGPQRDYTTIDVPGRNGTLHLDNKRWRNVEVVYPAFIIDNVADNLDTFRNMLSQQIGEKRLTDTFHPDEFYRAVYEGTFEPAVLSTVKAATFNVMFSRDPRRFLVSGETVQTYTSSGTINNTTDNESQPIIRIYGTGTVNIEGKTIEVTSSTGRSWTEIDCEIMEAYYTSGSAVLSCNEDVVVAGDYPTLPGGVSNVHISGSITKVEITPRFYLL